MLSSDIEVLVSLFDIFNRSIHRLRLLQVFPLLCVSSDMMYLCYEMFRVDVCFITCSHATTMIHYIYIYISSHEKHMFYE
jgi:hypothetical protein